MEIIQKYHPVFWIYSTEPYFPCGLEDYIRGCELQYKGNTIVEYGKLTPNMITDIKINNQLGPPYNRNENFTLVLKNKDIIRGNKNYIIGKDMQKPFQYPVPVFAFINNVKSDFEDFTDVSINIFFAYNGTKEPHIFDGEYVTIRYNNKTNDLHALYLSQHGGGSWINKKDLEFYTDPDTGNKYPTVYMASESHALYPHSGKYPRIFNFGSDFCNKGYFWSPQQYVVLPENIMDVSEKYRYICFVGNRSQDQRTGFPPYQTPTTSHSVLYDCPDESTALIERSLGENGFQKLLKILNIVMVVCIYISIILSIFSLYAESTTARVILMITASFLSTIGISILVLSFTLGFSLFDFGISLSGTQS